MVLLMQCCGSGKCMGGDELLEARRGHAPSLAAVSVGWSCLGKCSWVTHARWCLAGDGRQCLWGWLGGEESLCDLYSPASFPAPLGHWEAWLGCCARLHDVRSQLWPGWGSSVYCHLCLGHLTCHKCFTFVCVYLWDWGKLCLPYSLAENHNSWNTLLLWSLDYFS